MKKRHVLLSFALTACVLALGLAMLTSCVGTASQSSSFYNAGAGDFAPSGATFSQLFLYRFDTSAAPRTLTLPSAADIVASISSPVVGEVFTFGVSADGANSVRLVGGTNVAISASAATVSGNTTLTVYIVLDNVAKGTEAATVY